MKQFKKIFSAFLLALFVSLGVGASISTTPVHATDLSTVVDGIKNSSQQVMGADTKNKVQGLSKETLDIVGIIVMAIVTISGVWVSVKFAGAGDNSSAKATLKTALIFHILGLVFLASYFGFVKFAFKSLNLFK